jgi:hypothetical protein
MTVRPLRWGVKSWASQHDAVYPLIISLYLTVRINWASWKSDIHHVIRLISLSANLRQLFLPE